ncbi:MAG: creatininase family protein, partial [Asgard group archaeon]|nr:creatininase family protein [Asgard group archaeon]
HVVLIEPEKHGPHLPTITDALLGDALAHLIAERLGNTLQAPTISVGCSEHHMVFPGTITFSKETLQAIIHDYTESLARQGFQNIIFLPFHGGNFGPLKEVLPNLQKEFSEVNVTGFTDLQEFIDKMQAFSEEKGVTSAEAGAHAGEHETSLMLAVAKHLVKTDHLKAGYVGPFTEKQSAMIFEKGMKVLTKNGVLGDPTKATEEHGKYYLDQMVDTLTEKIEKLL